MTTETPHIAIEGIDGAGKTTAWREASGRIDGPLFVHRPTEGNYGDLFRAQARRDDVPAVLDVLTMMCDRVEHLRDEILPALRDDTPVVSDRSVLSTYAYQSHRLPVDRPMRWIDDVRAPWDRDPSHVVFLDLPAGVATSRADGAEKYEDEARLQETMSAYERAFDRTPARIRRVGADRPPGEVADGVVSAIRDALGGDW